MPSSLPGSGVSLIYSSNPSAGTALMNGYDSHRLTITQTNANSTVGQAAGVAAMSGITSAMTGNNITITVGLT